MKYWRFAILAMLVLLAGCTGKSKDEVLSRLVSDSEESYRIHLFYEDMTELDSKLLVYWNSQDELLELIQGIQLYDVKVKANMEMADALGLDTFPNIVVTNHKEITLETKDPVEVEEYFNKMVK